MSNWIAAWLAAGKADWDAQCGIAKTKPHRLDLLCKLYTARQERDHARAMCSRLRAELDKLKAYWRQDQDALTGLSYEWGKTQRELADARETIATLKAERDEALSRLGAIRLGAMEG